MSAAVTTAGRPARSQRSTVITLSTRTYDLRMNPRSAPRGQNRETWRSEARPLWIGDQLEPVRAAAVTPCRRAAPVPVDQRPARAAVPAARGGAYAALAGDGVHDPMTTQEP